MLSYQVVSNMVIKIWHFLPTFTILLFCYPLTFSFQKHIKLFLFIQKRVHSKRTFCVILFLGGFPYLIISFDILRWESSGAQSNLMIV